MTAFLGALAGVVSVSLIVGLVLRKLLKRVDEVTGVAAEKSDS